MRAALRTALSFFILALLAPFAGAQARTGDLKQIVSTGKGIILLAGDVGMTAPDLARTSQWTFFVQLPKAKADQLRRQLDDAGLLGHRVHVQDGLKSLYLADDLADAVVISDDAKIAQAEVLRVLRPEGKGFNGNKMVTKGFRKGTDEWSHPYRAPDNNPQSQDTVMKRPYMTHYMAEPWYCPLPMQSVISAGRIFKVFGDRSSARPQEPLVNKLLCMSAFNGTILWERKLSPGFMIHRNTLIATPDTLFLGDDKSCQLIDPITGKVRDEIVVPANKSDGPVWKWMALDNGILYALVGEKELPDQPLKSDRIRGAGWPWWKINNYKFGFGKNLLAFDPKSKKILWHHSEKDPIDSRGMAMLKGKLYYYSEGKFLACLNAKTGKVIWKNSSKDLLDAIGGTKGAQHWLLGFASTAYLKCTDDAVYFAGPNRPLLVAASAKDGRLLWKKDCSVKTNGKFPTEGGNVQLVIRPEGVYALGQAVYNNVNTSFKLHPLTGEVLATFPGRDRCTRATGCFDTIFTRGGKGGSTAAFDVTSTEPRMGVITPMRPACQDGVVTAHGYMFWGPWMCRCDMTQLGVISLGTGGKFDYLAKATNAERLQSYRAISAAAIHKAKDEWASYRRDNGRSVRIDDSVPEQIKKAWTWTPKAPTLPTAPIIVGDNVFLGGQDGVVRALYLHNGKPHWSAYTGGPIRYSPAFARVDDPILRDRLFVGSGDGYIYCFHAPSGQLRWRFRAAPIERTIPVYGTLTSTWPVPSVLVEDGVVYGAAGISNHDGTHVYALDADTGKIRWQNHSSAYKDGDELPTGGVSVQGPMLLHKNAVHFASGNTPPIASYALKDGKFTGSQASRGKDLYIRDGQVLGAGYPLYWRPEDDQFISTMNLETPNGVLRLGMPQNNPAGVSELRMTTRDRKGARTDWSNPIFHEIAAVAIAKNAIVVTGLNRDKKDYQKISAGLVALDINTGKVLWRQPLPAVPTAWGLAIAGGGNNIVVTLMDGRVMAFAK
ncbi:MAG: PQQ-binding-like beta-propeller repeat protein [Planctomycetes bacterium]|nr:PQQ-binding-like beta-propeller repeat protein [Planctomycetota bacterium]